MHLTTLLATALLIAQAFTSVAQEKQGNMGKGRAKFIVADRKTQRDVNLFLSTCLARSERRFGGLRRTLHGVTGLEIPFITAF